MFLISFISHLCGEIGVDDSCSRKAAAGGLGDGVRRSINCRAVLLALSVVQDEVHVLLGQRRAVGGRPSSQRCHGALEVAAVGVDDDAEAVLRLAFVRIDRTRTGEGGQDRKGQPSCERWDTHRYPVAPPVDCSVPLVLVAGTNGG